LHALVSAKSATKMMVTHSVGVTCDVILIMFISNNVYKSMWITYTYL